MHDAACEFTELGEHEWETLPARPGSSISLIRSPVLHRVSHGDRVDFGSVRFFLVQKKKKKQQRVHRNSSECPIDHDFPFCRKENERGGGGVVLLVRTWGRDLLHVRCI